MDISMDVDLYLREYSPSRLRHQTGRHRPGKDAPYAKPSGKSLSSRISGLNGAPGPSTSVAATRGKRGSTNLNPRRNPEGTPDVLKDRNPKRAQVQQQQHSKINEVLKGEEIRQWIRSRNPAPGVLDMSVSGKSTAAFALPTNIQNLLEDPWLKEQGILPPGDKDAPTSAGQVLWKLSSNVLESVS